MPREREEREREEGRKEGGGREWMMNGIDLNGVHTYMQKRRTRLDAAITLINYIYYKFNFNYSETKFCFTTTFSFTFFFFASIVAENKN